MTTGGVGNRRLGVPPVRRGAMRRETWVHVVAPAVVRDGLLSPASARAARGGAAAGSRLNRLQLPQDIADAVGLPAFLLSNGTACDLWAVKDMDSCGAVAPTHLFRRKAGRSKSGAADGGRSGGRRRWYGSAAVPGGAGSFHRIIGCGKHRDAPGGPSPAQRCGVELWHERLQRADMSRLGPE